MQHLIDTLDKNYINKELTNKTTAIGRFGNDFTSSRYHLLAGKLKSEDIVSKSSKTVEEYVTRFKKNLHKDLVEYMLIHKKQIQDLWEELEEYNHRFYYGGILTIINTYAMKERWDSEPTETPVQVFVRAAIQIHYKNIFQDVARVATNLCKGLYSLATPAYVSACNKKNQSASCYIMWADDDIESIAKFLLQLPAIISSNGGGVGIDLSKIRHSEISTKGMSKGVIPLARIIGQIMEYADQRNTRKGAANLCLTCWHIDVLDFISLTRKNNKNEETVQQPFNMFTTVMYNNLFMKRVKEDGNWTLFCPSKVPLLFGKFGEDFIKQYEAYENDETIPSYAKKTIKARTLSSQHYLNKLNAGGPYDVNLDAINMKNPLGDKYWIRCPNLCLEVLQYADQEELAVCNLSSICLPMFINEGNIDNTKDDTISINYELLGNITREIVHNLNCLIDNTNNSVEVANVGARNRRSLGIGVQGLADLLYKLDLHFEHEKTKDINKKISACIYWNALVRSLDLAIEKCSSFVGFEDSHYAKGDLQFDLWKKEYEELDRLGMIDHKVRRKEDDEPISPSTWKQQPYKLCNDEVVEPTWESLKSYIVKYGIYNAHVTCQQPTASTAVINNNVDMREAVTQNINTRELMKLDYVYINPHMEKDLRDIGLWNKDVVEHITVNHGSLASLDKFVDITTDTNVDRLKYVMLKYKTMYEIKNSTMFGLTAASGRYVCQSQSTNIYVKPNINDIKGLHHLAHAYGLKTTSYYTRINNVSTPQFLVSNDGNNKKDSRKKNVVCNDEICTSCSM